MPFKTGWKPVSGERNNCRDPLKDNHLTRLEVAGRETLGHCDWAAWHISSQLLLTRRYSNLQPLCAAKLAENLKVTQMAWPVVAAHNIPESH